MRAFKPLATAAITTALVLLQAAPAAAHGERTQPSWTRTTTSTFFDVEYSGVGRPVGHQQDREYTVDVGQALHLKGKVQISDKWPAVLGGFALGQIGVLMPGPVLALRNLEVNGVFAPGSVVMHPGDSFTFQADLVGRRPGRYHVHPRIDLKAKGPTVGAGVWIRVRDTGRSYTRDVTLASGQRVDMERFALGHVYAYQLFWVGLAAVFSAVWLWRKRLLSRLLAVRRGVPDRELISTRDTRFTAAIGALSLVVILGSFVYARNHWSTIPLQVRREAVPDVRPPPLADATLREARYDKERRSLTMLVDVTNAASSAVRVERLVVGPVSMAPASFAVNGEDETLRVAPDAAVEPGQKRTLTLTVGTRALEDNRLLFTNTPMAQIGGLLIVQDAAGQRSWVSLVADLIPGASPDA